jgi:hypothetical protein
MSQPAAFTTSFLARAQGLCSIDYDHQHYNQLVATASKQQQGNNETHRVITF